MNMPISAPLVTGGMTRCRLCWKTLLTTNESASLRCWQANEVARRGATPKIHPLHPNMAKSKNTKATMSIQRVLRWWPREQCGRAALHRAQAQLSTRICQKANMSDCIPLQL